MNCCRRTENIIVLAVLVLILPAVVVNYGGGGTPWFCKLLCPAGTLGGGIPLTVLDPMLRSALGLLFSWKVLVLLLVVAAAMVIPRPFCRYLCPLGAIYGLFNPVAAYCFQVREQTCTNCQACKNVCPMGISPMETPNSMECIRCGKCLSACKNQSLYRTFLGKEGAGKRAPTAQQQGKTRPQQKEPDIRL